MVLLLVALLLVVVMVVLPWWWFVGGGGGYVGVVVVRQTFWSFAPDMRNHNNAWVDGLRDGGGFGLVLVFRPSAAASRSSSVTRRTVGCGRARN